MDRSSDGGGLCPSGDSDPLIFGAGGNRGELSWHHESFLAGGGWSRRLRHLAVLRTGGPGHRPISSRSVWPGQPRTRRICLMRRVPKARTMSDRPAADETPCSQPASARLVKITDPDQRQKECHGVPVLHSISGGRGHHE